MSSATPQRVVSLVPSLTETVAATAPEVLVGATDWCTHPADLNVPRVGGTKWPRIAAVLDLRPDLVLANREENRREDVEALHKAGVTVLVGYPRTVPEALAHLADICALLGRPQPPWWRAAAAAWEFSPGQARRAAVPIWRRPWMVLGDDTFAADVLQRLGVTVMHAGRYPTTSPEEVCALGPDLIIFPDEPYAFHPGDGPEAFPGLPCRFVSGRHLTWYGPSLVEAPTLLMQQLDG